MIKTLIKYAGYGIVVGCFYFIVGFVLLDLFRPDVLYGIMQDFTLQVLGGLTISAVSFAGAIAYKFDRINLGVQIALHVVIVFVVALPIAVGLDWFSVSSPVSIAISIAVWIVMFFVTWFFIYLHGNHEVKKLNDRIKTFGSKE